MERTKTMPEQITPNGQYAVDNRRGRRRWPILLAALAVVALVAGGVWFWLHRDVTVELDGTPVEVMYRSSFDEVCEAAGVTPTAFALYSIGGNLIERGGGEPYEVTLDGSTLTPGQLAAVAVRGGEAFSVRNGDDVTEDSEVVDRVTEPRLVPAGVLGAVTYVSQWGTSGLSRVRVGAVSGEEIVEEVVTEPQDCVLASVNPHPSDGRKLVCLTFDDGPSAYTMQVLDILKEHGARATFFEVGSSVPGWSDSARAVVASGSEVMSHTMNHLNNLTTTSDETFAEVSGAFNALRDYAGIETSVIRPPYGNWDALCWRSSRGTMSASVIWNIDSHDWELPGVETIVANCTERVSSGDIILMHDGGGNRDQDLEALPQIIDTLHEQGFEFVTVSELMASDDRIPDDVARGYAPMPEGCSWPTEVAE